jgi:S-DNA-T family DNA segregation ATPase FtsK/SpoIIIE
MEQNAQRRLDLLGAALAGLAVVTALGIFSERSNRAVEWIMSVLEMGFGWGIYGLPLALVFYGLWILIRRFENTPPLSLRHVLGSLLIYLGLQTALQFAVLPPDFPASRAAARAAAGGGYLGAALLAPLQALFGLGGAGIALLAWLILSISLTFNIPVVDLFRWVPMLFQSLKTAAAKLFPPREQPSLPDLTGGKAAKPSPQLALEEASPSAVPNLPEEQERPDWVLPHIPDILATGQEIEPNEEYDQHRAKIIEETLDSFGAPGTVVEINRGPTITQFGVEPDYLEVSGKKRRVRVSKITRLADDLALALAAKRIRMEAPVPGKGYIGVEVPNEEIALVALRDAIQSPDFQRLKSPLKFALGRDVSGQAYAADLSAMPHLLIAGTTGSGKSVCVNSLISCFLLHNTPEDLRMIMVDPKRVELSGYDGIPHLLAPVVVDLERVVGVLQWVSREMDQRYLKFSEAGARHITDYNRIVEDKGGQKLPYLVVIIDELADLMMLAPTETEKAITRLAQLARATGIHLIISTQRPSTNVVTGLIKANFPARIAFATASGVDSRVILDQPGAETLLGKGDMLFQAPDAAAPVRLQGVFVSDGEINRLVRYWRFLAAQIKAPRPESSAEGEPDARLPRVPLKQGEMWEEMEEEQDRDPLWDEAVELVRERDRASISMLQRRLRIGYTRAARLIDAMEKAEIIGPEKDGPKARNIIDYGEEQDGESFSPESP